MAQEGDLQMAGLLLAAGADPAVKDGNGVTPLEIARQKNDWGMVKLLEDAAGRQP